MAADRHHHRTSRARSAKRAGVGALAALLLPLASAALAASPSPAPVASAATAPVGQAAPYLTLGWGDPPLPTAVMAATGIRDFTLAFILAGHGCVPLWDGTRPLLGSSDAASVAAIRAAGGDVSVSFGGWSGKKLGTVCSTPAALAAAYGKVVSAYGLQAIDIDIEHGEFTSAATRKRVVAALAELQATDPPLQISITFGTTPTGPDADGTSLIHDAAVLGFQPYAWTIMPFDFGAPESDMGATSVAAAQGLHDDLMAAYGESSSAAYAHMGISSMNGRTDETDETVSLADFQTILTYAQDNHLARLTFWMVDRDRPCPAGTAPGNTCSGIAQAPYAFTALDARFQG
ncbi:MAG: chitinase [Acidimicrobiales bacterium]|jgi:hypothetical protein